MGQEAFSQSVFSGKNERGIAKETRGLLYPWKGRGKAVGWKARQ
jgi:hypothetical protein